MYQDSKKMIFRNVSRFQDSLTNMLNSQNISSILQTYIGFTRVYWDFKIITDVSGSQRFDQDSTMSGLRLFVAIVNANRFWAHQPLILICWPHFHNFPHWPSGFVDIRPFPSYPILENMCPRWPNFYFMFSGRYWSHIQDFQESIRRISIIFRRQAFPTIAKYWMSEHAELRKHVFKDGFVFSCTFWNTLT